MASFFIQHIIPTNEDLDYYSKWVGPIFASVATERKEWDEIGRAKSAAEQNETLKAMNNHHAVVEEIRLRDLHPSDKDLSTSSCAGLSIDRIRGDGDATAWTQGLDLGTKRI